MHRTCLDAKLAAPSGDSCIPQLNVQHLVTTVSLQKIDDALSLQNIDDANMQPAS